MDTATIVVLALGGYFLVSPLVAPLVWRATALLVNFALVGKIGNISPGDDIRFDKATGGGKILLAIGWILAVYIIVVFGVGSLIRIFCSLMCLLGRIGMKLAGQ